MTVTADVSHQALGKLMYVAALLRELWGVKKIEFVKYIVGAKRKLYKK